MVYKSAEKAALNVAQATVGPAVAVRMVVAVDPVCGKMLTADAALKAVLVTATVGVTRIITGRMMGDPGVAPADGAYPDAWKPART